jgi:hypothetical protein
MSIEPIGLLTVIAGLLCLLLGHRSAFAILVIATLFGAAAAILVGPANIQPAHLLLAFVAATVLTHNREAAGAIESMRFPKPGFWLMCLVLYGVISAIIIPRLLAGFRLEPRSMPTPAQPYRLGRCPVTLLNRSICSPI